MSSPVLPLMGSSRTSGGIFRGHAHGNILNHADIIMTNMGFEGSVMGEVYLYVTDQYLRQVKFELLKGDSHLVVKVKAVRSMAPILDVVAHKFSIIQGLSFFLNLNLCLKFLYGSNLDEEYHLYLRESNEWIALGQFDQAIEDDDECKWQMSENNTPEIHLLVVSSKFKFIFQ